jgi:hypothetical protein
VDEFLPKIDAMRIINESIALYKREFRKWTNR